MTDILLPAILSGGAGSRLWPLSHAALPKQFQALVSEHTMLAETLLRVSGIEGAQVMPPLVIASQAHDGLVRSAFDEAKAAGSVMTEPSGKNTAPAAAMACHFAAETHGPDALVLLLPSDHHIGLPDAFRAAISAAIPLARDGHLVTFGIQPTGPETGYGYIRRGAVLGAGFEVDSFVEKPLLKDAEAMLASGGHDWNAGIFLFRAGSLLEAFALHAPEMAKLTEAAFKTRTDTDGVISPGAKDWATIEGDSIDYAIMQHTPHAAVVPVAMDWSDVGSFSALWELSDKDEDGNAVPAGTALIGAQRNYVINQTNRQIALVGTDDLVVIDTPDALVIVPREKAQDIKALVAWLKQNGKIN